MKSLIVAATIAALCTGDPLGAQADGLVAFPANYKVQFENPWVRLVRVHIDAGGYMGMHSHPDGFMFHVYLNDAGPVMFNHDGPPNDITRPPVTARSYRVGRATPENHAVLSLSATPSDFIRVEYKTRGNDGGQRRYPAPSLGTASAADVEHTGAQSRVTRVTIAAGASSEFVTPADQPALLIFVTGATIADASGGEDQALVTGAERFIKAGSTAVIRNAGTSPIQVLRFDFLTPPAS